MSTTRRLRPLPAQWAGPILQLVHLTRAATTPPDVDPGPWADAEAGQTPVRTGHKAARRTASAGQYAAHALRLHLMATTDHVHPLAWERPALSTWDATTRTAAAHRLLRASDHDGHDVVPVLLIADWLHHTTGAPLVEATGRLCRYVLEHPAIDVDHLTGAWHATHGHRLPPARGAA